MLIQTIYFAIDETLNLLYNNKLLTIYTIYVYTINYKGISFQIIPPCYKYACVSRFVVIQNVFKVHLVIP